MLGGRYTNYDLINKYKGHNIQFFIPAWTTQNVNRLPHDKTVFKYVLYLNEEELTDLIEHLRDLTVGDVPPSELRYKLYNTFESLAQTYFGKEIADDKKFKRRITIARIIERITGLAAKSQLLQDVKFTDIRDKAKVSDSQIEEIVTKIRESYEALRTAKNDTKGQIRYATDDGVFYWIP
jgi:hypothetical protein